MTNQLELRHLRYFIVLARKLHFRKAAEELYISQSALSQQIIQLESTIGVSLFDRTNRSVKLTQEGKILLPMAQDICDNVNRTTDYFQLFKQGFQGELRIGFVGSAMQVFLPAILADFHQSYPDVRLHLEELPNEKQIDQLDKGNLDIGFVRTDKVTAGTALIPIQKEAFTLVLPNRHRLLEEKEFNFQDLQSESFILYPSAQSTRYYDQIIALCADYGFTPNVAHKALHVSTIFSLVSAGFGISIIPSSFKKNLGYEVTLIPLNFSARRTELFAAYGEKNKNPALLHLVDLMQAL